jgi:hypothetical protein
MSSAPARPKPVPNGHSRPHSQTGGPGGNKRRLDRDRIVNGYGSSSDEEDTRSKSATAAAAASGIDNDLADMLGDPKDEEVDELMDSDLEGTSARGKKRDASVDDELSGELLELASAPPKKKKSKPAAAIPEASYMQHRPYSQPRPRPSRASVPAHIPSPPSTVDSYSLPLLTLMQSLPSAETQSILLDTFFHDPFLSEGFSLLRPQFDDDFKKLMERRRSGGLREGDATTLANVFAVLAIALRVLPVETGRLLLASGSSAASNAPRSASRVIANQPSSAADPTPLDQRYFELALLAAQIAEQLDAPSVMYVVHKFLLFRYATFGLRKDKIVLAGSWLGHAIKTAQALGLGKEWEGIPQGERELRRRVFWALFVADRQFSFDTTFPYTINDTHVGVHMPSPLADADLYQMPPDSPVLPPHSIEAGPTSCTALYIHTHLTRRLTPVLDAFIMDNAVTQGDLVSRFEASLDSFQETLPPYLRLFPLTDTRFDSQHSYLPAHRVRLHATLFGYRLGVHRGHLNSYLKPSSGKSPIRAHIAQICLASLRTQKSAKMLDPKLSPRLFDHAMVFEATVTLALIMYIERTLLVASAGSAPAMSSEYLSMRAGLADGLEMLDNSLSVTDNGHYEYARKAVRILREITAKVDAGPRAPYGDSASPSKPNGIRNPNGSVNGARESTSPSRERSPGPSSVIATVSAWVDSWRMAPIGYLLREASVDHWSKLLSGM